MRSLDSPIWLFLFLSALSELDWGVVVVVICVVSVVLLLAFAVAYVLVCVQLLWWFAGGIVVAWSVRLGWLGIYILGPSGIVVVTRLPWVIPYPTSPSLSFFLWSSAVLFARACGWVCTWVACPWVFASVCLSGCLCALASVLASVGVVAPCFFCFSVSWPRAARCSIAHWVLGEPGMN